MNRIANRRELAGMLPPGGVGAELGVCAGGYSQVLWTLARPRLLTLVDLWQSDCLGQPAEPCFAKVQSTFAQQLAAGTVVLHRGDSIAWLAAQPASSLDWIYLDSNHADHHVFRELCQSLRVVKVSGWICGHDYSAAQPGVVTAVDRFCQLHGLTIDVLTDEPAQPIVWRDREPWLPLECPFNSYSIRVQK